MSNDHDRNVQGNNEQGAGSSGGGNLPKPDSDLSDSHKRDGGDNPGIVRRSKNWIYPINY